MKLLLVLPLSATDAPLANSLFANLKALGGLNERDLLIVTDAGLPKTTYEPIMEAAKQLFARGQLIHAALPGLPIYPHAYNHRFECAAQVIASNEQLRSPWLWLDPRCVPMSRGWLRLIEEEYFARRKSFMGQVLTPERNGTAQRLLSAVAVYPSILPKRMMQRLVAQRGVEFERTCADLVVPETHPTTLIWTQPFTGGKPTCTIADVPKGTALAHTAAALMLGASLRNEPVVPPPPAKAPKPAETVTAPVTETPVVEYPEASRAAYYHSGNLGDVIYALAAIRLAGGGKVFLGPKQRRTSLCSSPIKEDAYEMLKPLLEKQPYIGGTKYCERHPGTDSALDLNTFRNNWDDKDVRARTGISNLAAMHAYTLGVYEKFDVRHTWLTVPDPIITGLFTVHRSPRYRNDAFPWEQVTKKLAGKLLFVGHPSEHSEFERTFNVKTAFWKCQDFLELARVILGSRGFIGNQSFPCAIAIGLGKKVLQEAWDKSADCTFQRPNFLQQPFTEKQLSEWIES